MAHQESMEAVEASIEATDLSFDDKVDQEGCKVVS